MRAFDRYSRVVCTLTAALLAGLAMCSTSNQLSSLELAKLDPPLQGLLRGDESLAHMLTVHGSGSGEERYAVILRVSDPTSVRASGLPIATICMRHSGRSV